MFLYVVFVLSYLRCPVIIIREWVLCEEWDQFAIKTATAQMLTNRKSRGQEQGVIKVILCLCFIPVCYSAGFITTVLKTTEIKVVKSVNLVKCWETNFVSVLWLTIFSFNYFTRSMSIYIHEQVVLKLFAIMYIYLCVIFTHIIPEYHKKYYVLFHYSSVCYSIRHWEEHCRIQSECVSPLNQYSHPFTCNFT